MGPRPTGLSPVDLHSALSVAPQAFPTMSFYTHHTFVGFNGALKYFIYIMYEGNFIFS